MKKNKDMSIMEQWDYWRYEIANGNTSSAPRDWFESILDKKYEDAMEQPVDDICPRCASEDWVKSCQQCGKIWE